jgi:cellulose biosynthesis protein BcsQ
MLVISVALLKGGASKTTTAVALAEVAALSVPTVAIHTDPMGSLRRWAELAAEAGHPLRSQVIGLPVADLGPRAADRRAHRGRCGRSPSRTVWPAGPSVSRPVCFSRVCGCG